MVPMTAVGPASAVIPTPLGPVHAPPAVVPVIPINSTGTEAAQVVPVESKIPKPELFCKVPPAAVISFQNILYPLPKVTWVNVLKVVFPPSKVVIIVPCGR